jgi:hypothetical protein
MAENCSFQFRCDTRKQDCDDDDFLPAFDWTAWLPSSECAPGIAGWKSSFEECPISRFRTCSPDHFRENLFMNTAMDGGGNEL